MSRKTYVYDPVTKTMREGSGPRRIDGPSGDGWRFSDRLYSSNPFVGVDGTVIDSKKKHREYMKRHNLTTMDDFKGTWDRKAQERAEFYQGTSKQLKQDIREDLRRVIERGR